MRKISIVQFQIQLSILEQPRSSCLHLAKPLKFRPSVNFLFRQSVISISLTDTVYKQQTSRDDVSIRSTPFYPRFSLEKVSIAQGYTVSRLFRVDNPRQPYERVTEFIPRHICAGRNSHGLFFPRPHLHRTRSLSSATDVDLLRKIESRSRLFKLAYRNICNGITIIRINRKHRVDLIDLYGSRL